MLGIVLVPMDVLADNDIVLSCPKEVMVGNSVECSFSFSNLSKNILGVQVNYEIPDGFSFLSSEVTDDWEILNSSSNGFVIANLKGVDKNEKFATVKFMVSNDVNVGQDYSFLVKNIKLTDGESDIPVSDVSNNIHILSVLDIVESISVNNNVLELKDGVNTYSLDLSSDLNIQAKLKKEGFTFLDGYGPRTVSDLKNGNSTHYLKIAQNGKEVLSFAFQINYSLDNVEDKIENPKTGGLVLGIVVLILLISLSIFLIMNKKNRKGSLKNEK